MPNVLYDALFAPLAERDTTFLILPDGRTISGAAFLDMVHRYALTLQALGLKPGDRLAVQVQKSPEALALYGAAVASGVVYLPLNVAYTADEMDYFIGNSGARMTLVSKAQEAALVSVAKAQGSLLHTFEQDGSGSFLELATEKRGADFQPVKRGTDEIAAFLYTSGTTGRSKGAMLTHGNLLSNAEALISSWRFTKEDVLLHALPIFHTHGLFVACNVTLLAGGSMIFLPGFDVSEVMRLMPLATSMMGVPTFYTRMLDHPALSKEVVSHMRLFVSGSAPLLVETHNAFAERTGHLILERYGMTETNMNTSNPYYGDRRAGTVGMPLPGVEVRVTDVESGATLENGQVGMIEVSGPNVFIGYWGMTEKTKEEFRKDGFFITGDLGQIDADGYLSIVGRQKDLIISGGYNIYPKEIELVLDEASGVLEFAVIGVPHPDFGEGVVAVLVPKAGTTLDEVAIAASIAGSLARFKQPKAYRVVDALPRNTMGKVQKNVLRDRYGNIFAKS